jgi:hypothetical protein
VLPIPIPKLQTESGHTSITEEELGSLGGPSAISTKEDSAQKCYTPVRTRASTARPRHKEERTTGSYFWGSSVSSYPINNPEDPHAKSSRRNIKMFCYLPWSRDVALCLAWASPWVWTPAPQKETHLCNSKVGGTHVKLQDVGWQ